LFLAGLFVYLPVEYMLSELYNTAGIITTAYTEAQESSFSAESSAVVK
jgi:hypothetical protein